MFTALIEISEPSEDLRIAKDVLIKLKECYEDVRGDNRGELVFQLLDLLC